MRHDNAGVDFSRANAQRAADKELAGGIEMDERKEPEFVKFDRPGFVVSGRLLRVDSITVDEGRSRASRYTVEEGMIKGGAFLPSGVTVAFLGVYAIDASLRTSDLFHFIVIRYEGEDSNVGRNGNNMKRFKIHVSRNVVETSSLPF